MISYLGQPLPWKTYSNHLSGKKKYVIVTFFHLVVPGMHDSSFTKHMQNQQCGRNLGKRWLLSVLECIDYTIYTDFHDFCQSWNVLIIAFTLFFSFFFFAEALWSTGAFLNLGAGTGLGNFWKRKVQVWRLKIF